MNKSTARPDCCVGRYSLLAYLIDMSRRCAPSALHSGRSLRFLHRLSLLALWTVEARSLSLLDVFDGRATLFARFVFSAVDKIVLLEIAARSIAVDEVAQTAPPLFDRLA